MKDQARIIAYKILTRIDTENAYSNLSLNYEIARAGLEPRDRGLTTELVYGVLRMRAHLDYIIDQFSNRKAEELDPGVRNLLRLGVYQLKYTDKIPSRAAVHSTVEIAKEDFHQGITKFLNGVLRNIDRGLNQIQYPDRGEDPVRYISILHSHPEWLVKRWCKHFGIEETVKLCEANNLIPDLTVRTNTLKIDPATLADDLFEKYGLDVFLLPYPYEGILLENATGFTELSEFKEGCFTVQGQAAMLVAHAMQLSPGLKIVDMCAAPGGKTTHIAALMENEGDILAIDIHPHKIDLMVDNCKRLGVSNVRTICGDVLGLDLTEQFDRVLLDAPCSGLGLLAQKPEIRWAITEAKIRELADLQKKLCQRALKWLKTGGIFVYSTCTITEEENQQVVAEVLESGRVELLDLRNLLPAEEREIFAENKINNQYLEFLPHISETEGFFIAAFRKIC